MWRLVLRELSMNHTRFFIKKKNNGSYYIDIKSFKSLLRYLYNLVTS